MTLKEWRIKTGVSQRQLGHMISKDQRTVRRYENGELTPSSDTMRLIEKITGGDVTANDLIHQQMRKAS